MRQPNILLPSTLTCALQSLEAVLGARDVHEYLSADDAAGLRAASTLLQRTLETAIQVCDDPAHERELIARAEARIRAHQAWVRERRRVRSKPARP